MAASTPKQPKKLPRIEFKLTASELLFFPKQYDPTPQRQPFTFSNDLSRKTNYLEKIKGKSFGEQRQFRAKRDARYLHKKANSSNETSESEEEKAFCFDHLVNRCNKQCGRWHQMRHPRLFGVCKYYLSGVCMHGDLCEFMHEDFPCRYYYLDLEHPKVMNKDECRFKHGGPLPKFLCRYFKKQIEIWVKEFTKNKPEQFDSVLANFMHSFEAKQSKLAQEYKLKDTETPLMASTNDRFSLENTLSIEQMKALAQRNITTAAQINQTPVDDLLEYGLTMDQILKITTNTCKDSFQAKMETTCVEAMVQNTSSNDQMTFVSLISSLDTNYICFQGFSNVELEDAEEMLRSRQYLIHKDVDDNDLALCEAALPHESEKASAEVFLQAKCNESEINNQEYSKTDSKMNSSYDSDDEFSLVINESL